MVSLTPPQPRTGDPRSHAAAFGVFELDGQPTKKVRKMRSDKGQKRGPNKKTRERLEREKENTDVAAA